MVISIKLEDVSTHKLVAELQTRIGVKTKIVAPYEDFDITVNGAAIILIVID